VTGMYVVHEMTLDCFQRFQLAGEEAAEMRRNVAPASEDDCKETVVQPMEVVGEKVTETQLMEVVDDTVTATQLMEVVDGKVTATQLMAEVPGNNCLATIQHLEAAFVNIAESLDRT